MKQGTLLGATIVTLSVVFAGSAAFFQHKESDALVTTESKLKSESIKLDELKQITTNEQLTNNQIYNKQTRIFLDRASKNATSSNHILQSYSSTDEKYGVVDAYTAIGGIAGAASSLKVKENHLTFNEMSDGSIIGVGQVVFEVSAASDDADGTLQHVNSPYTVFVTLDKFHGSWRVSEIKLGDVVQEGDANDEIY